MVKDVYFLVMHEPYDEPGAPVPVNGVIVHALTLLHKDLPQPDAGRIYRCLTEFPGRTPSCLVALSTLNYELDDGRLWPQIADDWRAVIRALVALTRIPGRCESRPLAFPEIEAALLATGPFAPVPPGLGSPERGGAAGHAGRGPAPAPPVAGRQPRSGARGPGHDAVPAVRHVRLSPE